MVAELAPERDFRSAGCGENCRSIKALIPGQFGRSELMLHDPEAHEAYGRWQRQATVDGDGHTIVTGGLQLDLRTLDVTVRGRRVTLSPSEIRLLNCLARKVGQTVPYDEITLDVWGAHWIATGTDRVRQVTLNRLRGKLSPDEALIVTVPSIGLRLDDVPAGAPPNPAITWNRLHAERWAKDWEACQSCGRTTHAHVGRGYCVGCYGRASGKLRSPS